MEKIWNQSDVVQLLHQVSRDNLLTFNQNITREVRLSGSAEELRAFEYVQMQLQTWGFRTELSFSEEYISLPEGASLQVGDHEYPCITHSMAITTQGLDADVVYIENSMSWSADVAGKLLLIDGLAMPETVKRASDRGAVGVIFVNADYTHEMIVSTVWGHPTPETVGLLPKIPVVSVTRQMGESIKAQLEVGTSHCTLSTQVNSQFRPIPTLIADLERTESEQFLLFSGHVDSWHYGAMDNGSANALMLEVARILSENRERLKRSIRLAFWSGHSHGRYAGSSRYCDEHWEELYEECILHVNVDSVGGKGSCVLTEANCMAETRGVATDVIRTLINEQYVGTRYGRSGDQSFWGPGIPSLFMGLSEQPLEDTPAASAFASLFGGGKTGGFGWWWHTTEDTLDKVDGDSLVRDTKVYLSTIFRFLTDPILPVNHLDAATELHAELIAWQDKAGSHFDMTLAITRAQMLMQKLEALQEKIRQMDENNLAVIQVNEALMALSRVLVPLNYVKGDRFNHDLAIKQRPIPKLSDIDALVEHAPGTDMYRLLRTSLLRKYNEVTFALKQAIKLVQETNEFI